MCKSIIILLIALLECSMVNASRGLPAGGLVLEKQARRENACNSAFLNFFSKSEVAQLRDCVPLRKHVVISFIEVVCCEDSNRKNYKKKNKPNHPALLRVASAMGLTFLRQAHHILKATIQPSSLFVLNQVFRI